MCKYYTEVIKWDRAAGILLFLYFLLCCGNIMDAQIIVNPSQTAAALAQKLAGQGVTISNATLNCASHANGFFNVVNSNLGLDSGIVLTTGRVATQGGNFGVNGVSSDLASTDNGFPGDVMLNALAGQSTIDACDLEFDVVPNGDTLKFKYVFSSEEYLNAVCGPYNDAFAFFISGPGISGADNMALVPGTTIPVTINTINNGIPGRTGDIANCHMMGPGSPFTSYFIDNSSGTTLTHQGLTTVLQAIHAVKPCNSYHLKIVIADAGDPLYDSGVFLKAGSLQTGNYSISSIPSLSYDTSSLFCVKGCLPGRFRVRNSEVSSEPKTVRLIIGGDAVSGVDYSPIIDSIVIPANQAYADVVINGLPTPLVGAKTIQLFILSQYSCVGTQNIIDSASMPIYDTIHISMITPDTIVCAGTQVLLQVQGDSFLFYNWSPGAGLSNPSIQDPVASPVNTTTYEVSTSLPGTSCPAKTAHVMFNIKLTPRVELNPDTTVCFNTSVQLRPSIAQSNLYYSYSWLGPDGFTSTLSDPEIGKVTSVNAGIYTISVEIDTNNCKAIASTNIVVNTPDIPVVEPLYILCLNKRADSLTATGTNLLWYTSTNDTPSIFAPLPITNEVADYNYYVTQKIGDCESPKASVEVEVKKCCDGNIIIPNAFTPNGDGRNDIFEPVMDYGYRINYMYIFNRWGQMIFSGIDGKWNGNFGGAAAEIGTYFYEISFSCILGGTTERSGDLTLIR